MTVSTAIRPATGEFAPYYERYIALATEDNAIDALERQLEDMKTLLQGVSEEQAAHRYAPGKWSIKQLLGHVADAERVFAYRALRFARGDRTPLPGFDENEFAESAGSDHRTLRALLDEVETLRRCNLSFFRGLDEAAWTRRGKANDVEMSVRAIAFAIAGHGRHHMNVVKERYLSGK